MQRTTASLAWTSIGRFGQSQQHNKQTLTSVSQLIACNVGLPTILASDECDIPEFQVTWVDLVFWLVVVEGCGVRSPARALAFWDHYAQKAFQATLDRFRGRNCLQWSSLAGISFPLEEIIVSICCDDAVTARSSFQE